MKRLLMSVGIYREFPLVQKTWIDQASKYCSIDIFMQRWQPERGDFADVNNAGQRKIAGDICLAGFYDYLLFVGDAILLPSGAVDRFIESGKPIISGIHRLFKHRAGDNHLMARVYDASITNGKQDRYLTDKELDEPPEIIETTEPDINCLFFTRKGLLETKPDWSGEWNFVYSLIESQAKAYCHKGIRCGHYHIGHDILEV